MRIFGLGEDKKNIGKHCIDFSYCDLESKKDLSRDERAPHNFRSFRDMKMLINFFDTIYE